MGFMQGFIKINIKSFNLLFIIFLSMIIFLQSIDASEFQFSQISLSTSTATCAADCPEKIFNSQNILNTQFNALRELDALVEFLVDEFNKGFNSKTGIFQVNLNENHQNKLSKIQIFYPKIVEFIRRQTVQEPNNSILLFSPDPSNVIDAFRQLQVYRAQAFVDFYEDLKIIDGTLLKMVESSDFDELLWGFHRLYQQAINYKSLYEMIRSVKVSCKTPAFIFSLLGKINLYSTINFSDLEEVSRRLETDQLCPFEKKIRALVKQYPGLLDVQKNHNGPRSLDLIFHCNSMMPFVM